MQPAIYSHSADGQMDMAAHLMLLGEVLRKRRDCFKPVCSVKDIAICQLKKKQRKEEKKKS